MAESQVPYDYTDHEASIIENLSEARFTPYLKNAGFNKQYAFNLYLYNARLSKAFLYPLHILEVTLRNRMNEIFSDYFDDAWYTHNSFRSGLSAESRDALDRGMRRAKNHNKEDIISTLTFDFWSNLFRPEYDRLIWQTNMQNLLPNASKTRKEFEKTIRNINDFRNRIAHYEPIHKLNLSQIHVDILNAIQWLSVETSHWVKHYSTVNECLRMKPSPKNDGQISVSKRCDNNFTVATLSESINKIQCAKFTVCVSDQNEIKAVVSHEHLAKYLISQLEGDVLLIEFKTHLIGDLIDKLKISNNMHLCSASEPYKTIEKFFKNRVGFIIVQDNDTITGVVEKSHRRY